MISWFIDSILRYFLNSFLRPNSKLVCPLHSKAILFATAIHWE